MSIEPSPAKIWHDDDKIHIDVRGLAPPAPFRQVLDCLDRVERQASIIAYFDRDPQLLYAKLAERGWTWERIPGASGDYRLRLSPPKR